MRSGSSASRRRASARASGFAGGDEETGLPVVDDLREAAVVAGHDAAAGGCRLERGVRERVGPGRRDDDDVGVGVEGAGVGDEADEAGPLGEPELAGQAPQGRLLVLLAGPRVPGHHGLGHRHAGHRPEEDVLALPRGDPSEDEADEWGPRLAPTARPRAGLGAGEGEAVEEDAGPGVGRRGTGRGRPRRRRPGRRRSRGAGGRPARRARCRSPGRARGGALRLDGRPARPRG